jgi:hypothetical protein
MTLRDKFKKQLDTATPTLNRPFYQAKKCEKIADKFAVEFAIWLVERVAGEKGLVLQEGVLERFKKEKGL